MRRTDRLYALVEELRARAPRPVSRNTLADALEVTPRTVARDILSLQQAGVPIWSQRGRGGGYAIESRWSMPSLNFDATEAVAVIAALATARSLPFGDAGRRAERKLLNAMTVAEATRAMEVAARLRLGPFGVPATQSVVTAVEEAVVDRRVVELGYRDRQGVITSRAVEAHGLHLADTGSYLVGWCRLRDAGRAFRLDRIVSLVPTEEIAPARELDSMLDWIDEAVPPRPAAERGVKPTVARRSWGPPRRAQNCTGSDPNFVRAVAHRLPGVQSTATRGGRTRFKAGDKAFLVVVDEDSSATFRAGTSDEYSFVLAQIGRDEVRAAVEEAWSSVAAPEVVASHRKARQRWAGQRPITEDDVRRLALSLPGANEGPIWGQDNSTPWAVRSCWKADRRSGCSRTWRGRRCWSRQVAARAPAASPMFHSTGWRR